MRLKIFKTYISPVILLPWFILRKLLRLIVSVVKWCYHIPDYIDEYCAVRNFNHLPESTREGSDYFTSKRPDYIAGVYIANRISRTYLGTAFRIGDYLVTCAHIYDTVPIEHLTFVMYDKNDKEHIATGRYIKDEDVVRVAADIVAIRVSAFQSFPIKQASIGPMTGKNFVRVQSFHESHNTSIGILSPDAGIYGSWIYNGSTRKGYSGSPYIYGDRVVGIHLGGGAYNYGFSTTLIQARLVRKEDTEEETIKAQLRAARDEEIEVHRTGNPDEVELGINGKYHIMDFDDWHRLKTDRAEYQAQLQRGYSRRDYEEEAAVTKEDVEALLESFLSTKHLVVEETTKETPLPLGEDGKSTVTEELKISGLPKNCQEVDATTLVSTKVNMPPIERNEPQTPDTPVLEKQDIPIPQNELAQCLNHLENIQLSSYKPVMAMLESLNRKLEKLEQQQTQATLSSTTSLPSQEKKASTSGSTTVSGNSTPAAPPASVASVNMRTLATHLGGMASVTQQLQELHSLKNAPWNEFVSLRDKILANSGLPKEMKKWLIRSVCDRIRQPPKGPSTRTQSTSSSKASPSK